MVCYLDIAERSGAVVNGVTLAVGSDELPALEDRERNYERYEVAGSSTSALGGRVWAYSGRRAGRARAERGSGSGAWPSPAATTSASSPASTSSTGEALRGARRSAGRPAGRADGHPPAPVAEPRSRADRRTAHRRLRGGAEGPTRRSSRSGRAPAHRWPARMGWARSSCIGRCAPTSEPWLGRSGARGRRQGRVRGGTEPLRDRLRGGACPTGPKGSRSSTPRGSRERRQRFLAGWERARHAIAEQRGYLGTRLHRSVGATDLRFVNLARWSSPLMFARALQQPEVQQASADLRYAAHPALYTVVRD